MGKALQIRLMAVTPDVDKVSARWPQLSQRICDAITDDDLPKLPACRSVLDLARALPQTLRLSLSEAEPVVRAVARLEDALAFDRLVYERLMPVPNREEIFGKQQVMNEKDEVTGTKEYLLINATSISFDEVFPLVRSYGGIAYPAHVDKSSTSLLSNLGSVPPESTFACAEFHDFKNLHRIRREHPYFEGCNVICCSDAHYLEDIHEPEYQIYARSRGPADVLDALENRMIGADGSASVSGGMK